MVFITGANGIILMKVLVNNSDHVTAVDLLIFIFDWYTNNGESGLIVTITVIHLNNSDFVNVVSMRILGQLTS